jgi:hypothetical protein
MTKEHPITPPPELVDQWVQATESNDCIGAFPTNFEKRICTAAARWGADQELEAIQKEIITQAWFADPGHRLAQLRAALRAAADQVVPTEMDLPPIAPDLGHFRQHERRLTRQRLLAIAAELEDQ